MYPRSRQGNLRSILVKSLLILHVGIFELDNLVSSYTVVDQ